MSDKGDLALPGLWVDLPDGTRYMDVDTLQLNLSGSERFRIECLTQQLERDGYEVMAHRLVNKPGNIIRIAVKPPSAYTEQEAQ